MTSERAQAYGRVMKILDDKGATKLHPDEQERVRAAADTLLFCEDISADDGAGDALADVESLIHFLVEAERWEDEEAAKLRSELTACGPAAHVG